ncbi:phage tail assembly protein [Aquitalea magnusonii]|uniref:Tail assembly chaperone E/41/14-like protein n=1 Tax=Aquitalea magnusonii TaxID=332411 RepID=A0A318JMD9_9NEIS|nr:phage tail assembly protein [Aquitalea magnusonii]PXX49371.1 tail assembly chaperone E/41/14-like protein [Aquitalea magnusonii]
MAEENKAEVPDELTIELRKPVELAGETTYVLELREPTVDELDRFMKALDKHGPIEATKLLISAVSGVSVAVLGKVGARDFKTAESYLSNFFG